MSRTTFEVPSSAPFLAGLTWFEKYGCYSCKVDGWLAMSFSYDAACFSPKNSTAGPTAGYKVTVCGKTLVRRAESVEEAAKLAVRAARTYLVRALTALPEEKI